MRRCLSSLALLLPLACNAASSLVVCTEASPEGFDIVQFTAATTGDAAAETIFDRLVQFAPAAPACSRASPNAGTSARMASPTTSSCAAA